MTEMQRKNQLSYCSPKPSLMIPVSRKSGLSSWDSLLEVTAFLGANANKSKTRTKSSAATCSVEQGSIGTPSVLLRCFCMPPRLKRRRDVKLCSRKKHNYNINGVKKQKVQFSPIFCRQNQANQVSSPRRASTQHPDPKHALLLPASRRCHHSCHSVWPVDVSAALHRPSLVQ